MINFNEWLKTLSEFSYLEKNHLAIAVLGAPASGKSFTVNKIKELAAQHDERLAGAMGQGEDLTVDILRKEFQSGNPKDQLVGFYHAYNLMKKMAKEDPGNYEKWLEDIRKTWSKIDEISGGLKTSFDQDGNLVINSSTEESAISNAIKSLPDEEAANILKQLDGYQDFKRVVRWVQQTKQSSAHDNQKDIVFDEAGDDPDKIVGNFMKLRSGPNPYITAAFLLHGDTPATNLIQNAGRMVSGSDGGRDSSGAIVQAWTDIQMGLPKYVAASENKIQIKNSDAELTRIFNSLSSTTTTDNKSMKAIDLFVGISTQDPGDAYKRTAAQFAKDPLALKFFNAILFYKANYLKMDANSKQVLSSLISGSGINSGNLKQVFQEIVNSNKFNHPLNNLQKMYQKIGGVAQPQQKPQQPQAQQPQIQAQQQPQRFPTVAQPSITPPKQAPQPVLAGEGYGFKSFMNSLEYTIYCDMDGVLVDFDEGTKKHTSNFEDNWHDLPVDFFSNLSKTPWADKLMRFLRSNFSEIYILSAAPKPTRGPIALQAKIDKKEWMQKHFGFSASKIIIGQREEKQLFAKGNKNNILIDDTAKNILEWENKGGTGVMFDSFESCIRQLKQIISGTLV